MCGYADDKRNLHIRTSIIFAKPYLQQTIITAAIIFPITW